MEESLREINSVLDVTGLTDVDYVKFTEESNWKKVIALLNERGHYFELTVDVMNRQLHGSDGQILIQSIASQHREVFEKTFKAEIIEKENGDMVTVISCFITPMITEIFSSFESFRYFRSYLFQINSVIFYSSEEKIFVFIHDEGVDRVMVNKSIMKYSWM
jgi:hypothetical protein